AGVDAEASATPRESGSATEATVTAAVRSLRKKRSEKNWRNSLIGDLPFWPFAPTVGAERTRAQANEPDQQGKAYPRSGGPTATSTSHSTPHSGDSPPPMRGRQRVHGAHRGRPNTVDGGDPYGTLPLRTYGDVRAIAADTEPRLFLLPSR